MISRRELLMWAGLSTTNLLGTGCSPARVTSGAPAPVPAAFILSVAPLSWKALIVVIYAALAVTLAAWVAEAIAAAIAAALLGMALVLSPF